MEEYDAVACPNAATVEIIMDYTWQLCRVGEYLDESAKLDG